MLVVLIFMRGHPSLGCETVQKSLAIVFGLETKQIKITHLLKQRQMWRERIKNFRCRKRNMQEKPMRLRTPRLRNSQANGNRW